MHCQAQMIHNNSIDDRARKLYWWSGRRKSTGGTGAEDPLASGAGAEDPLVERAQKVHWWSGHRRSTSGAGVEDPLVERAQKIHLVDQTYIGLYNEGLWFKIWCLEMK